MKENTLAAVAELTARMPALETCAADLREAVTLICESYHAGKKLLVCGNGGSAADSEHIVGELMKGFLRARPLSAEFLKKLAATCESADYFKENLQGALPAISLVNPLALTTAFANDQAPDLAFAQQILGLGNAGDVLIAISTSGNSTNVIYALQMARAKGVKTIALLGKSGGKIKEKNLADVFICAPEDETYRIQEYHLPIYHMLCMAAEREFFDV